MRKLFIFMVLLIPFSLNSQVREQMLPDNSVLGEAYVTFMFEDSQDRIWVGNLPHIYMKDKDGWHKNFHDSLKPYMKTFNGTNSTFIHTIYEDNNKNIIMKSIGGTLIYNNKNQWQLFTVYDYNLLYLAWDYIFKNNRIYIPSSGGLLYMDYNQDSGKYSFTQDNLIVFPQGIDEPVSKSTQNDSTLIMYNNINYVTFNYNTQKWTIDSSLKTTLPDTKKYNNWKILQSKDNRLFFVSSILSNELELKIIDSNKQMKVFRCPWIRHDDAVFEKPLFADKNEETIIIPCANELIVFNEKTGFRKIPKTSNFKSKYTWWNINQISLINDELWIGNYYDGIYICNIQELLATAVDVPTSVEEINPYLPMMQIYSIYPQPNVNFVNFEYYLQTGFCSELKVSLYDSFGKKIENISYDNTNKESIISTIRLNTSSLTAGVYILQLDDGVNKATAKFIVEK